MSDLTIIILTAIGVIGTVVALKFTISFDVNEYIKDRRAWKQEVRIARTRALCPHIDIVEDEDGDTGLRSAYISPSGTTQYQCQNCGHRTYGVGHIEGDLRMWGEDLEALVERLKEFREAARRANLQVDR